LPEINGVTFNAYTNTATSGVISINAGSGETRVTDVRATNITTASQSMSVVSVNGGAVGPVTIKNVRGTACDCPLVGQDFRVSLLKT
jgi:hypothetical protein